MSVEFIQLTRGRRHGHGEGTYFVGLGGYVQRRPPSEL